MFEHEINFSKLPSGTTKFDGFLVSFAHDWTLEIFKCLFVSALASENIS